MKKFTILLALAILPALPVLQTGCTTSQQVNTVTTLEIVGQTADTAMQVAAQLYHNGQITTAQWNKIAAEHDNVFLPAYKTAVAAVNANLSSYSPASVAALATQLAADVAALHP